MNETRLYDIRFDSISLSRPGGHAVLRFRCPACSRTVEEALPIFTARQDTAGALIFWDCPLCSTPMRLEKKPLQEQAAAFYQQRLDGYKKVVNQQYVNIYSAAQDSKEDPAAGQKETIEPPKTGWARCKKNIWALLHTMGIERGHLEKWGILPAKRFIRGLPAYFFARVRPPDPGDNLREWYEKDVLPRLPWHLEENDAREALDLAKALRPLLFIRFGIMHSGPMGDFTVISILYLREKLAGLHQTLDYLYIDISVGCANYAFLHILSRMLNITPIPSQLFYREYLNRAPQSKPLTFKIQINFPFTASRECFGLDKPCFSPHFFFMSKPRDNHFLQDGSNIALPFTEEEESRAQRELAAMGLPEGAKIVLLHVRDNAYYGKDPQRAIRDVDINLYRMAAEHLAASGYYVLRTGAKVAAPLEWVSERIIDYATRYRSEFMDIWLFAKADLTLTSGSGPDAIPYALGHHVLYTNITTTTSVLWNHFNTSHLFVHVIRGGERVRLEEFIASKAYFHDDYVKHGFTPEYNSPEEILEAVKEKLNIMAGGQLSSDDMRLQVLFRDLIVKYDLENNQISNVFPYEPEPNLGPLKSLVSSVYLRQYRDELERAGRALDI